MRTTIKTYTIVFATIILAAGKLLASGEAAHHEEGGIPWATIAGQAANLGLLILLVGYLAKDKIKQIFPNRQKQFSDAAEKTAEALKLAEQELKGVKQRLLDLESSEAKNLQEAKQEAMSMSAKMVSEAEQQSKKIIADTQMVIAAEVQKAKNEIREEIINKAFSTAEQDIGKISAALTKKSEQGFINDLSQATISR